MIENYRLPYLLPEAKKEENAKNALCILLFYNRMTHVFVSFFTYSFHTKRLHWFYPPPKRACAGDICTPTD